MAEEIISVTDIASQGVVIDTPPVALSPNVFTDVRNVRFKDGAVRKISGELLLNDITEDLVPANETFGQVRYFAVWESPNRTPTGCYYIWVVDYVRANIVVGQKIYVQDHTGTKRDITPAAMTNGFTFTITGWQHTIFSGGFAFIINNGIDRPHYILDTPGNTNIANLVLAELPGWDGYDVNSTVITDTFSTGNILTFDLGQKVDFVNTSVEVTVAAAARTAQVGTPAGSGTVNTANFVPGALPAYTSLPSVGATNFQLYNDAATNTTICYIGGMADGNEVIVKIKSRVPVNVTAGIIQSFGSLLVAGDLTEKSSANGEVVRRLSGVVKTSDVAVPGAVPNNWDPFAAGVSTADEFTLSETNVITEMKSLQGNMYIYSTNSIHVMRLTGNVNIPVQFGPVTDEYGCLSRGSVMEYDGKHFVVGNNDLYTFSGNPGNIQSLSDGKIREYFYNNLNPIHEAKMFTLLNHHENEIWVCYPTLASFRGECDEALLWNYRDNTWTIRDLNNVVSGGTGPIKGGGVPTATIAITGNSGNAGYTNVGRRETQAVTINGSTPKATIGTKAIKTVAVGTFSNFTTDVLEVVDLTVTGTTGPNVVNAVNTLTFPAAATFTYDRDGSTYLDGGASAVINGDASIGNASFPAITILGTNQADGATINMTTFVAAVKDYINNNNAFADFTATASTNVLTLTSDQPGARVFTTSTFAISGGTTSNLTIASSTAGVGVYGITAALSPAISMQITAPAVAGVHAAIDETVLTAINLSNQAAIQADIVTKLQAITVFNGSNSAIYSVDTSGGVIRFTAINGGNYGALTIAFSTAYSGTSYTETTFGGNLTSNVSVVTTGVDNNQPQPLMTVSFPDGTTTDSAILTGTQTRATVVAAISTIINSNVSWSTTTGTGLVTATAAAVGLQSSNFDVTITSIGALPAGFASSTFTEAQTRAGVAAASTTDTITLTPPLGSAVTVNFDNTSTYPAYDPDTGGSTASVTATEIATALQAAWNASASSTAHFSVVRAGAVLTFTSVSRDDIVGEFSYSVAPGDTRTGTLVSPLITNSVAGNITVTAGIASIFSKMTRVTITINTASGSSVIFDRHYGEGPGRLLDPDFTAGISDSTYGDSGVTSDAAYLNLYYDPAKDLDRTNTSEQAKPNGTVTDTQTALLKVLTDVSTQDALELTPDSTSAPTNILINPRQFGIAANYVTGLSPNTEVVASRVAPTTAQILAVAIGNTVATTAPTFDNTGTTISTAFDIVRSWADTQVNPNEIFPIFAQSGYVSGVLFNRLRAADLGYDFGGTAYISYAEREQMSITPNFDTETLGSLALWADGGTIATVGGTPQRATLQVRARATNNPGELPYLTTAEDDTQTDARRNKLTVNDFVVGSSYKTDLRSTGRFLNYRIDDAAASTSAGYTGSNTRAWNVSGLQLRVTKGGAK